MQFLDNRIRLVFAILILGGVLVYWGLSMSPQERISSSAKKVIDVDYFATQAVFKQWHPNGRLQRILTTIKLEHSPRLRLSYLTTPEAIYYADGGDKTFIRSKLGEVADQTNVTRLTGDVSIRSKPDTPLEKELKTELLWVYPQNNKAETEQPVKILMNDGIMKAVGMDVDLNTHIMNLHTGVKGTYNNES